MILFEFLKTFRFTCNTLKCAEIKQFTFPKKNVLNMTLMKKHVAIPCGLEVSKCSTKQTVLILVIRLVLPMSVGKKI